MHAALFKVIMVCWGAIAWGNFIRMPGILSRFKMYYCIVYGACVLKCFA